MNIYNKKFSCSPSLAPSKIVQYLKGRISGIKEKILGTASMGKRIFL